MRVSIRDVARQAGVSHVTVANVLNGRQSRASSDTSERVLKAARELNYIPVAQPATQRRHVETRIIGLVYDQMSWNDYWGLQSYQGLRDGALEHGYDLLTILRQSPDWALSQQELRFLDRRSDGLIFMVPENREAVFKTLVEHKIPTVSCYIIDVPQGIACITLDNAEAMRVAVRHCIDYGHRNILFLSTSFDRTDFKHRLEGYDQEMAAAGLQPQHLLVSHGRAWLDECEALLKQKKITAVVSANDATALPLQSGLTERGWRIPRDLSIVGMDDLPVSAEAGLTTIRISGITVGRNAIDAMVSMIQGGDAEANHRVIPVELIERDTVARPAL